MARKKLVRNYSVNVLFAGAMLFAPVMVADLNAAPTQTNQVTWTNTKRGTDTTGTKFGGQVIKDSYIMQKSSTGQTRRIRTGYELYKYDYDQRLTYSESWKYNELGKAKEKNVTQYLKGTTRYDYQKTYKWVKPGQGSSYLAKESYYNRSSYDLTRKEYNSKGYLTRLTVTGKNDVNHTVTTYTRNSKNAVTKQQIDKYVTVDGNRKLESKETRNYYANGKVKDKTFNTYKNSSNLIDKGVYNSFYENGTKKLAKDTYYYQASGFDTKAKVKEVRENHYNSKGIKIKNVVKNYDYVYAMSENTLVSEYVTSYYANGKTKKQMIGKEYDYTYEKKRYVEKEVLNTFYSNGKKKLARDIYFENYGKWKEELRENQYNSKGQRTKNIYNEFYQGKRDINRDTYYYTNGKKKEVRENSYSFAEGRPLITKLNEKYYTNGKPKLFKKTDYNSDQTINYVKTTSYTTKGKKTESYKYY